MPTKTLTEKQVNAAINKLTIIKNSQNEKVRKRINRK